MVFALLLLVCVADRVTLVNASTPAGVRGTLHPYSLQQLRGARSTALQGLALAQMTHDAEPSVSYLPALTEALKAVSAQGSSITTEQFARCCDSLFPFFDHLGPVFGVARYEFQHKLDTLKEAGPQLPMLSQLVDRDKAQGKATVKNSPTRNLHRLTASIQFMKILFEHLMSDASISVREAASTAYETAMAPFHTFVIKGVVRAGMLTLPNREHFLQSIGADEQTARPHLMAAVDAAAAVVEEINKLLADIPMPASDVWLWPSA